jgi:ethanolamine utilization protein EutQ (cupin superfamily)
MYESSVYVTISDGEGNATHAGSHPWQRVRRVVLAACAIGFVTRAAFCSSSVTPNAAAVAFTGSSAAENMTFDVVPHFQGSTAMFSIEPGGLFSAALQAGSNSTHLFLDHRLQYIVDGEVYITDGTGQTCKGKAGDLFYIPYGSNVTYHTPQSALLYVVSVDKARPISPSTPLSYQKWMYDSARNNSVSHFPNVKDRGNKRFEEYSSKLSPGTSSAFFDEVGCFKFKGRELVPGSSPSWNFCCGAYYLAAGPAFTSGAYKHHYEIDLLLAGELQFREANGQHYLAKTGDLVHNPRHVDATIETPTFGKFLTVSLSDVDDFWR